MIFSGMISSNTAECKFYLKSGVIKFQFIIIIISVKRVVATKTVSSWIYPGSKSY